MYARPGLRFVPHPLLVAAVLVAAILAEHAAAGRPGRGRAAGAGRPALDAFARVLVRCLRGNRPISQGVLAAAAGLARSTIVHYLDVLGRRSLVTRVDDQGQPVPHGTQTAPGSAARYRLDVAWTPELAAAMPEDWQQRRALAWACLRLGADDEFVGGCLRRSPASHGDRGLWAWYCQAVRAQHRHERQRVRAAQAAAERADRGVLERLAALGVGNSTPLVTEPSSTALKGLELAPGIALAREARRGKPPRRVEPGVGQLRRAVEAGLVSDDTEAAGQWADLARAAELVDEDDPVAVWGQLRRIAETGMVRHRRSLVQVAMPGELSLRDLVGRYVLAGDEWRADVPVAVAADRRRPVESGASWCCGAVRRGLVRAAREAAGIVLPAQESRWSSSDDRDDVGDLVVTLVSPEPLYVPPPEPERRLTAEELQAIRERVAARRADQDGDQVAAVAPAAGRSLAAVLELTRAARRSRSRSSR